MAGIYGNLVRDEGFSGTAPERAAHAANIVLALERVDAASEARKSASPKFLHYFVSSVGLGGTNGAPIVDVRWKNELAEVGWPIQADTFVESSLKRLIATATIRHDGVARTHNVVLATLQALMGW